MRIGYYGKLPLAGDFLRRGLSAEFTTAWDGWMLRTLERAQQDDGTWRAAYLSAPIWRFSLAPGLLGPRGAMGIMIPSHDRVGRLFPFCIAAETDLPPLSAQLALHQVAALWESVALHLIAETVSRATLEAEIDRLPRPVPVLHLGAAPSSAGSIWATMAQGGARVMQLPQMPTAPWQAAALFDTTTPEHRDI